MLQPLQRFSNRVDNYVKYRPTYPAALLDFLATAFHLQPGAAIADIGSGTGILTALLLQRGWKVYGIEPNEPMRTAADTYLATYTGYQGLPGTAEHTGLPDASVNLVTAAQAFHWFEPEAAKKEFLRILQPGAHIALIWNLRITESAFGQAYEAIKKQYGTDYEQIRKAHEPDLTAFFAPDALEVRTFSHSQFLDKIAMKGQLLSSSYMPLEGQPGYTEMIAAAEALFEQHQQNGAVEVAYETKLYYNRKG